MWYHRKWALAKVEPRGMVRFTLSVIADHCNEEHECWIGLDRLASELGLTDTGTASRHCAKLAEMDIIEISERWRDDGTRSSNLYRLNVTDREIEPFMDPAFDPYKKVRPARLERRKKVREKQETARAIRAAMEDEGLDPRNIAGVPPADLQGSPPQDCQGHPGSFAGVTPAKLRGHEQSLDSSADRPVDEPGDASAATMPPGKQIAGGERASGLPAGHGAKTAPRERTASDQVDESAPPPQLSAQEKRQRERDTIQAAIAAVESSRSPEEPHKVIEFSLMALGWADEQAVAAGHAEALAAIVEPRWTSAETTWRYDRQIAAHALLAGLNTRPLSEWPTAVLEPLGLTGDAAAA
jgi:hypothetical protein